MKKLYLLILFILSQNIYSQVPEPVSEQDRPIILYNAQVHIGNGTIIENGYICFDSGKITHVGDFSNTILRNFENHIQFDLNNKLVYPGLILPISKVGLEDISAIRATRDHTEIGDINSNIRTLTSYNTDSDMISTFRFNGILLSQVTPDGDLITGNSSIMMMEGGIGRMQHIRSITASILSGLEKRILQVEGRAQLNLDQIQIIKAQLIKFISFLLIQDLILIEEIILKK